MDGLYGDDTMHPSKYWQVPYQTKTPSGLLAGNILTLAMPPKFKLPDECLGAGIMPDEMQALMERLDHLLPYLYDGNLKQPNLSDLSNNV